MMMTTKKEETGLGPIKITSFQAYDDATLTLQSVAPVAEGSNEIAFDYDVANYELGAQTRGCRRKRVGQFW